MDVTETNRPVLLENDLDARIENSSNETIYDYCGRQTAWDATFSQ